MNLNSLVNLQNFCSLNGEMVGSILSLRRRMLKGNLIHARYIQHG